jgi:hypothetical protein
MVSQEVTRTFIICKDSYFICHLLEQQPKKSSLETMKCVRVPTCNPKITPYSPIRYLIFDTIHQVFQDDNVQLLDLKLENILWLNNTMFIKGQFGTIWGAQRQKWDHVPFPLLSWDPNLHIRYQLVCHVKPLGSDLPINCY